MQRKGKHMQTFFLFGADGTRILHRYGNRLTACCLALSLLMTAGCGGGAQPMSNIRQTTNDAGDVESISFIGSGVRDSDLEQIAKETALREVTFQECSSLTEEGFAPLADAGQIESLNIWHTPVSDGALKPLAGNSTITSIRLLNTRITGLGLEHLSSAPIREVELQGETFTPPGMEKLAALSGATKIKLISNSIKLSDLSALSKFESLEFLDASQLNIGEQGVAVLSGLENLKHLHLNSPEVDDAAIDTLNTLVGLEELYLLRSSVSDEGLGKLNLPNLKFLNVANSKQITDAGLSGLANLTSLEILHLEGTSVRDDLTGLGSLPNLKNVSVLRATFEGGRDAVSALRELLPEVNVRLETN